MDQWWHETVRSEGDRQMGCGKHFWTWKTANYPKWEEATKGVMEKTGTRDEHRDE